jgi:uncharacterized protein (TIGR02284 family)
MSQSTDQRVTSDLLETLEDGRKGFTEAAEKLAESDQPDIAATFTRFADQRAGYITELKGLAADYGDVVDDSGSAGGAVHRGWIALKDALTGSDHRHVVSAALTGENHAVSEFQKALDTDISPRLRSVVDRQLAEITAARDEVEALAN